MESIAAAAATALEVFTRLLAALRQAEDFESMPLGGVETEYGRFKIWCGNLGALQSGRSSLDFRLRESTVMKTNVLKHLTGLVRTLTKSHEVASGTRLPLEKQSHPDYSSTESSEDDSDVDDEEVPDELHMHMVTIREVLADLFKLSFRIRNSATRQKSLRPTLYKDIDEETGVDKLEAYSEFDKRHIEDHFIQLRRESTTGMPTKDLSSGEALGDVEVPADAENMIKESRYLIDRLVATVSLRRKILRYWQRHAKKLAEFPQLPRPQATVAVPYVSKPNLQGGNTNEVSTPVTHMTGMLPSAAGKTVFSMTEATKYEKGFDDILETQSVISYASTSFDLRGNTVELPPPPAAAFKDPEFLCPYCGVVCPSHHAKGRAWRAHIVQDIQPYICTYEPCQDAMRLYSSRNTWLEHERLAHRRVWQCFDHAEPKYRTQSALEEHLQSEHRHEITESQVRSILDVSESSIADVRTEQG